MDSNLDQELEKLATFLWQSKKLSFSENEYPEVTQLEKKQVINLNGDVYVIKDYKLFAAYFFEYYRNKNAFEFSADFSHTVAFIIALETEFLSSGYISQFYFIKKEIWLIAIVESNKCGVTFVEYLTDANVDGNGECIFEFLDGYSELMHELNLTAEVLYRNALLLKGFAESDATYNGPLGSLLMGIKRRSQEDAETGLELFLLAIKDSNPQNDIISATIAGVYNKHKFPFYEEHLQPLLALEQFKDPVINGLSIIDRVEREDAELFIGIFDREKQYEVSVPIITKLLFSVLKAKDNLADLEKYVVDVFARINDVVLLGNDKLAYYIIREIAFLDRFNEKRIDIIEAIIQQPYFSIQSYGKSIEQVFWYVKDVSLLENVLTRIAEKCPFEKLSGFLSVNPNGRDKVVFDEMLIGFISNNKASLRFIGLDIFNQLSLHSGYRFSKNILDLQPIMQYRLWVGLTQDYKEPKFLIPALISLLDSPSGIVKEAFVCKLEEYTENYGGQIIHVLKENIGDGNSEHVEIVKRIEKYLDSFHSHHILPKKQVLELNPFYTHNGLFTNFNKLFRKKFNAQMQRSVAENSFLSKLARNVQLAKGGGWKIGGKENVSKLSSFESGFSLPREYFIFPNKYELIEGEKMKTDWLDEDFSIIQKCIENE